MFSIMKKIFLFISIAVLSIILAGMFIFGSLQNSINQTSEIRKKFENDTAFIQDDLKDLPLLLFENKNSEKDYFVIIISGDGGWRGFIDNVGKTISEKGPSVVGLNLIPYLSQEKSPEQIAKDIHRIIYNFSHTWKKKKVLIGGYSFGGEIIPFFYNMMDENDQSSIEKIFFIAISNAADFKVSPIYYYNPKKSKPVLPEIQKISDEKFIFFCDNTNESICKSLPGQNHYKIVQLNYSHLFLGHFKEVANIIAQNVVY
jgi:type IV secretory pathway VirJ component